MATAASAIVPPGGYDETPPAENLKCIVASVAIAGGYWLAPKKNKWILVTLIYAVYDLLAWYDSIYQCKRVLGPSYLADFYSWVKPQDSKQIQQFKHWDPKIKRKVQAVDIAIIVLMLFLLPGFLAWNPTPDQTQQEETDSNNGAILFVGMTVLVLLGLRLFVKPAGAVSK